MCVHIYTYVYIFVTSNTCKHEIYTEHQKLLIYSDFLTEPSVGFTENGSKIENIQWAAVFRIENALLMSEDNGHTPQADRKATVSPI